MGFYLIIRYIEWAKVSKKWWIQILFDKKT